MSAFLPETIKSNSPIIDVNRLTTTNKGSASLYCFILTMISTVPVTLLCQSVSQPSLRGSLACLKLKPDTCGGARTNWKEFKQLADLSFCAPQTLLLLVVLAGQLSCTSSWILAQSAAFLCSDVSSGHLDKWPIRVWGISEAYNW